MPIRLLLAVPVIASLLLALVSLSSLAALPSKMSDVVSVADLEAEIAAKTLELESTLTEKNDFKELSSKRRSAAIQLALLAQALAVHDQDSKLKNVAAAIRDVAVSLSNMTSYDDANQKFADLKTSIGGTTINTSSPSDQDWSNLVPNRALMDLLREKSDQVRKSLRRIKDPEIESRNASTMAVIGIAVGSHAHSRKTPAERMMWTDWSYAFQKHMIRTARAIRERDSTAVLEHFTAAQAACDLCHEQFKK